MLDYSRNKTGFTLVELLITLSILVVILTVVLMNQSKYTDRIALTNLADDIGLAISQAQVYSIGVKELSTGSNSFSSAYGVTFSLLGSGSNTAYINFADLPTANGIYDGNWDCLHQECLSKVEISRGNVIEALCLVEISGMETCDIDRIDVSFTRPNTEAEIKFYHNGGIPYDPANMSGARIKLISPAGSETSVAVFRTGQVSANPPPAGPILSFYADPAFIPYNGVSTLIWSSTNATSCDASGYWAGSKATSDSESTGSLDVSREYTLTCVGDGGSTNKSVTVNVTPPTCQGTYLCSQWDGDSVACTSNGHTCNWVSGGGGKCQGGTKQCSTLNQAQCTGTPNNCSWQ